MLWRLLRSVKAHLDLRSQNRACRTAVVTTLSPVELGREGGLVRTLEQVQNSVPHPMSALQTTHFARYVVVDSLGRGYADLGRHVPASNYLLFSAAFDSEGGDPRTAYLASLCDGGFRETADKVWGHCLGYPGTGQPGPFVDYLIRCSLPTRLVIPGYGWTVEQVQGALAERERLTDFVLQAQERDDAQLLASFVGAFGGEDR